MTHELQALNQSVERYEAAFAAFTRMYEARNPAPVKREVEAQDRVTRYALPAILLASVVVSGSRTVEEFGGGIVGGAAFITLELAAVFYPYYRTRKSFNKDRSAVVLKLAKAGMILALIVAVVANVHAVAKEDGIYFADWVNTLISLAVAVSAPILAWIAGEVLGMESVHRSTLIRLRDKEHEDALRAWRDDLHKAWISNPLYRNVRVKDVPVQVRTDNGHGNGHYLSASASERTDTDGQNHGYGQGYERRTDARTKVREHLAAHPEDISLTVRELATKVAVGKTVAAEVLREFKNEGGTT